MPGWRNGSAPAYGAGGCGFESHVGLVVVVRKKETIGGSGRMLLWEREEEIVYLGVAGSTPALGFLDARLAQSVEHKTLILVSVSFCQLVLFGALGLCRVRKQGSGRDPFYFFDRAHGEMVS